MTVDYIRVRASNKKEIQKMIARRRENIGFLFMILITVAIAGLVGLLFVF